MNAHDHEGRGREHAELGQDVWAEAQIFGEEVVTDRQAALEVLKTVPGIDPVLAIAAGTPELIPEAGWLINTHIAPTDSGVINITRYNGFSLVYSGFTASEEYGQIQAFIQHHGSGTHTLVYENPDYPDKETEPIYRDDRNAWANLKFDGADVVDLSNGGKILDATGRIRIDPGTFNYSMGWQDIDRYRDETVVEVNRAIADLEQLPPILAHACYAMGLSRQDFITMLNTLGNKLTNPIVLPPSNSR